MSFENKGKAFWKWLESNGAKFNNSIELKDYRSDSAGRGVAATRDIKEEEVLFSIPRSILFSQLTSSLKDKVIELNELSGWGPLILCLMYEIENPDSHWKLYFDVLPRQFSTPMFWNQEDLKELEGTDVISKIGRLQAEELFHEEIEPIISKYTDLFDENKHTIELFHICGSLIMAYSFNDESQKPPKKRRENEDEGEEDEEEEDEEGLISMVPMADMLNHKTGFNNARLFHEPDSLQMKAVKNIKKGEQIYNTYGNLCNADLLRKYGFIDIPNEFDLVELDGPLAVEVCCDGQDKGLVERKIDFLMEEGVLDECYVIDKEYEIPEELIISVHVLCSAVDEFEKMEEKQKLPKSRLTQDIKEKIQNILKKRLEKYPNESNDNLNNVQGNKEKARIICNEEKSILKNALEQLGSAAVFVDKRKAEDTLSHKRQKK